MRKTILLLTLFTTLLHAQEESPAPEDSSSETEQMPSAAIASTRAARSSTEWRNWVFAGSAAIVFTIGVLVVTLNTGTTQSGH